MAYVSIGSNITCKNEAKVKIFLKKAPIYRTHFAFSKGLEYFYDVRGHPYVDEHELGELVPGELPLWKQPPTQDEDDQDDLLKDPGPLLRLKSDLQVDVKDRLQALLLLGEDAVTSFLHKNSNSNIFKFIFVEIYCCY